MHWGIAYNNESMLYCTVLYCVFISWHVAKQIHRPNKQHVQLSINVDNGAKMIVTMMIDWKAKESKTASHLYGPRLKTHAVANRRNRFSDPKFRIDFRRRFFTFRSQTFLCRSAVNKHVWPRLRRCFRPGFSIAVAANENQNGKASQLFISIIHDD